MEDHNEKKSYFIKNKFQVNDIGERDIFELIIFFRIPFT